MNRFLFLIIAAILFVCCDGNRLFEDHKDFPNRLWAATDTARFSFRITDTGRPYNLYYTVRNSIDYPYSRLFVNYVLKDSTGTTLAENLTTSYLFDAKTGEPFGRSGLGDVYDHREALLTNHEFVQPGTYTLDLIQYMRLDTLPGVLAIGARVEVSENK